MLKNKFSYLLLIAAVSMGVASCSDDDDDDATIKQVTFEDLEVSTDGYWKGDKNGTASDGEWGATDYTQTFSTGSASFENTFSVSDYGTSWKGFGYSQLADSTVDGTYENEMYVYGTAGANDSKTFAVAYSDGATVSFGQAVALKSVMVNNNTYAYKVIRDGNAFSTKFDNGSWFSVTFTGYDADGKETGSVNYLLADFQDGREYICNTWEKVDLSALKNVTSVKLSFDGSDTGNYGLNTPTYVCLDNLEYAE